MAAVLCVWSASGLSHRSAAALWGLRGYSERRVEVTTPHEHFLEADPATPIAVPEDEITVEARSPVTTVPRTILDLAAVESTEASRTSSGQAEFRRLWDQLSLGICRALSRVDAACGSSHRAGATLERAGRARTQSRGTVRSVSPSTQPPSYPASTIGSSSRASAIQVDCHWPDTDQIVELDGWEVTEPGPPFAEDRARDRRLRAAGYSVTHLTWNQLDDEPREIAARPAGDSGVTARPG